MTGTPVQVVAPAKLTLTLRITGVRADGYHLIDAEMVALDLADVLTFAATPPGRSPAIALTGPFAGGLSAGPDNLVARAMHAVRNVRRPCDVTVDKRIPHGGGLGGGSTDAAAVLRWAGVDDVALAASIGADVPFCVVGGRARVRGIGDEVDPLPFEERTVTLGIPEGLRCSTPAVYRAWDELGAPTARGPNDLEPAALVVEPRLGAYRDALGDATGETPVLAGSGATWFVPGAHPGPGRIVARTVPPHAPAA